MEFWGVEVLTGKPLTCEPGENFYIHLTQVSLGETKGEKGSERVVLKVKVDGLQVVIGTLSYGKVEQITLDLIFNKCFTLSHNSTCNVYFTGYKTEALMGHLTGDEDNKKSETLSMKNMNEGQAFEKKVPVVKSKFEAKKVEADDDEDNDDEGDEFSSDEDVEDDMGQYLKKFDEKEDSDEEEDDSEEESEEEQPQPVGKKRLLGGAKGADVDKKAKTLAPLKGSRLGKEPEEKKPPLMGAIAGQQAAGKKDTHEKKGGEKKISMKSDTPSVTKKLGQYSCEPCRKTFQTESALNQHNFAKHK